jgi:hypothetical protein
MNISDGKATDGNPEPDATALKGLSSSDGPVLFFNAHLSSQDTTPVEYPGQEQQLTDVHARLLFRMSSLLPPRMREAAKTAGFTATDQARGFVYNAHLISVIRFLDIGTRVSPTL